jgi:hypothetical protein
MKPWRKLAIAMAFIAAWGTALAAPPPAGAAAAQPGTAPAATAPQTPPKVCLDVQSSDPLIQSFAARLRETIGASGAFSLASPADSCNLRLHVPGNLLRFQTAGDLMVSTVVIVTSSSDRYLSTSISACRATDLKPCAVRAVAAAKLALLMGTDGAS